MIRACGFCRTVASRISLWRVAVEWTALLTCWVDCIALLVLKNGAVAKNFREMSLTGPPRDADLLLSDVGYE